MIQSLVNTNFASQRCRQLIMVAFAGIALLFPSTVFALDIEELIWGFGNQKTKGECIPLSLLLSNNTPEVFDEFVQLNQLQFGSSKVGAPLYRNVYLAPYTSQWVQFYPYIISQRQTDWSLNWGPGNIYSLAISKTGSAPANDVQESVKSSCVILASVNSLSDSGVQFKRFSEELFPPTVTATDSLDEVILDHVPRWDAARRDSFMDWLYRGGILHLLPNLSGENLRFPASMSEINVPLDHFRVGSGLVIRHQTKLNKLDQDQIESKKQAVQATELSTINVLPTEKKKPTPNSIQANDFYGLEDFNANFLYQLSEMTQPDHNWTVIYLFSSFYIFLIFPGCYLFNKTQKGKGYLNSLLFLLITVGVFSTIFWSIGKRGYGETTTIHSLVIARPLKGNQYDLTCWINSFVTEGTEYQFSAEGTGGIFTTAQDTEKIKGAIFNGIDSQFLSDIPPFSARSFIYRVKSPYPKQTFEVLDYKIGKNSTLEAIKIKLVQSLPPKTTKTQVLYDRILYDLKQTQEQGSVVLELAKHRTPISVWQSNLKSESSSSRRYSNQNKEPDIPKIYDSLYERLVMKNMNLLTPGQFRNFQGEKSRIILFIYCDIPDEFKLKTNVHGLQQGRALFVNDLALPENIGTIE